MPHRLMRKPVDEVLRDHPCTCIDGRTRGVRHSVAGGSFAVLAESLHALQDQMGHALPEADLERYLMLFADQVSPLYLHSDEQALQRIFGRMGLPPETDMKALNPQQQRSFAELASWPEMQGCGHLKLMMENPADYGVSARLVQRLLKVFYRRWFAGAESLVYEVLEGEHAEESVFIADDTAAMEHIALFRSDEPAFYLSQPARWALTERFAEALVSAGALKPAAAAAFVDAVIGHHDQSARRTLDILAGALPKHHIDN